MKKLISIITALSLAASALLSAITVSASEKITADEVKAMIYSTGLSSYPKLWDKIITDPELGEDVLKPETRTVKDVIDIDTSYREFFIKEADGAYTINNDDDVSVNFNGFNKDGKRVKISYCPENQATDTAAESVVYFSPYLTCDDYESEEDEPIEEKKSLVEDYDAIAEIINDSSIGSIEEIKIIAFGAVWGMCVYVKDSKGSEYAIPSGSYTDDIAEKLGREVKSIEKGSVIPFGEWCATLYGFQKNLEDYAEEQKFEEFNSDEIRDTDTRAAYIGTESEFFDVSGELISYVNELYDLGIINGYDASDVNLNHMNTTDENSLEGKKLFLPEESITRAEAAAMLTRMLKYEGKYSGGFNDVSADDWFADDVAALMDTGLINGYSDTEFAPYANIKYQEVMKILVYALGYSNVLGFGDNTYPFMTTKKATELGLTEGLASFDTTAPITRGDMAIMLSNTLDTHMLTFVESKPNKYGAVAGIGSADITLIDYLNGKKLNGRPAKPRF